MVLFPAAKKWSAMFSHDCTTRVSGSIGMFAIMAFINVVAFFAALRIGFVFYQLPADATATESPQIFGELSQRNYTDRCNAVAVPGTADDHLNSPLSAAAVEYPVCLLLSIGDDTAAPAEKALPFSTLYRLFDAAKAELSDAVEAHQQQHKDPQGSVDSRTDSANVLAPVKLLVGVDYTSVACKMARDSLQDAGVQFEGVALTCETSGDMRNNSLKSSSKASCGVTVVGGSERYVTQLTLEWAQLIRWNSLRVVDLDEPDVSLAPRDLRREMWRPTVATAFSSNHIAVGMLLLRSIGKAGMEAAAAGHYNISIVVYALEDFNSTLQGLLDCVVHELNDDYKVPTEVRRFNFSAYPSWMRINQTRGYNAGFGEYAWKVVMIHEMVVERGFLLWTDAGCRVTLDGLVQSLNYTRDNGFANRRTTGVIPQYVHAGMLKYLRYVVHYDKPRIPNCDGSAIGLTMDKYSTLVRPWYDCGMTRQCIAPDGSHHGNHRQDQAALTLLADMSGSPCEGISSHVRRHMDNHPHDYAGAFQSKCYQDPLKTADMTVKYHRR